VVAVIEAGPIPVVITQKGRDSCQCGNLVNIQKHHEERIGKIMPDGQESPMAQGSSKNT
jgi:hypothetical protein